MKTEDFDLVIPLKNLLEYSFNYSEAIRSLWFHSKDELVNFNANIAKRDLRAKFLGNVKADGGNGILRNSTIAVPLQYLSNLWRSLETPLINCNVQLKLKTTNYCVLSGNGIDNDDSDSNIEVFTPSVVWPTVCLCIRIIKMGMQVSI